MEIAKEAGFDVSKADWLRWETQQRVELSDEDLQGVTGGTCTPSAAHVIGGMIAMFAIIKAPSD
jgi:hypothetical protein